MAQDTINNDLFINGTLTPIGFNPPSGCIDDGAVEASANIDTTKLKHRFYAQYAQGSAVAAAAAQQVIYVCNASSIADAEIVDFFVGNVVEAGTTTTITVKLLKNGTDILSADITLTNSGPAAYGVVHASGFTSTELVAGDVIEIQIVRTTGTNYPEGVFATLVVDECAN